MKPVARTAQLVAACLFITATVVFVDKPLALLIKPVFHYGSYPLSAMQFPDLLLPFCGVVTVLSWSIYGWCGLRGIRTPLRRASRILGTVTPLAYLLKEMGQHGFARLQTRIFLQHPELPQFQFFHWDDWHGCFPSGHMSVCCAVLLVLCRFLPRLRTLWIASAVLVGAALVLTDYHYIGDVFAGALLGFLTERLVVWGFVEDR
jgi:membrane-associated phospholipid phosphatase